MYFPVNTYITIQILLWPSLSSMRTLEITFNILNYLQFYKTVLIMYIREYNTVGIFDAS